MFSINQIVNGKVAGTYKVLSLRTVGGDDGCQIKPVNPENHQDLGTGEFFLPFSALEPIPYYHVIVISDKGDFLRITEFALAYHECEAIKSNITNRPQSDIQIIKAA